MIRYITFCLADGRVETVTCNGRRDLHKTIDRILAYVAVGRIISFLVHDGTAASVSLYTEDTWATYIERGGFENAQRNGALDAEIACKANSATGRSYP
jgi:hypothetical protein